MGTVLLWALTCSCCLNSLESKCGMFTNFLNDEFPYLPAWLVRDAVRLLLCQIKDIGKCKSTQRETRLQDNPNIRVLAKAFKVN